MSENDDSDLNLQNLNSDAHLFNQRDRTAIVIYNISFNLCFWYFWYFLFFGKSYDKYPFRSRLMLRSST